MIGENIAHYHITTKIGEGGMGESGRSCCASLCPYCRYVGQALKTAVPTVLARGGKY